MEGVVDHIMRDLLTRIGGIDLCVTEFVRVSNELLPPKVFYRHCPELHNNGKTPSGTPVVVQLLGGKPEPMAENAARAAELGAPAIDINFGCPAKTVNRHDGGASLLKNPARLFDITSAIRNAVPLHIPVTAKMRLGYNDTSLALENAKAIEDAGASEITVHGRTKTDGYKPPAHWDWINKINKHIDINVIANGEIWTIEDYQRCRQESGCADIMIGRGLIRYPDLALQIKQQRHNRQPLPPVNIFDALINLFLASRQESKSNRYLCDRIKQWASLLGLGHPAAMQLFQTIKREKCPDSIYSHLLAARNNAQI